MKENTTNFSKGLLKRKKLLIVIVVVVIGAFVWRFQVSNGNDLDSFEIKKGTVQEELILTGSIRADEHANLSFSTSGKIIWVGISEGDWVKKGQALAKIDTVTLNADLQRARADYRSAQATADRARDDVKDNDDDETFTQKETRTIAEVARDKAWDNLLKAEYNLSNATLYAPFEGIVTYVANSFSGVNVLYTATQFEILNPETIYFDISADQSEVVDIHKDQKVFIVLDSYSETELEGEILFIGMTPKTGEAGSVYKVKVEFAGNDMDTNKLRIGLTGDAKFVLSKKSDVLYIPPEFINSDSGGKYIRIGTKKNDKVYVELGIENEERVEISGDISEGDTVYD